MSVLTNLTTDDILSESVHAALIHFEALNEQHEREEHAHRVRHEYEYCDVCVNRSDDNMLDVWFQDSQRLTSDPTTTPQQCHKEIDNAAMRPAPMPRPKIEQLVNIMGFEFMGQHQKREELHGPKCLNSLQDLLSTCALGGFDT